MAPNGLLSIFYGIGFIVAVEAWLPSSATMPLLPAGRVEDLRGKATSRNKMPLFAPLKSSKEENGATSNRPDLIMMKQKFERSMDSKLVMDYVKARENMQVLFNTSMPINSHSKFSPVFLGKPSRGRVVTL